MAHISSLKKKLASYSAIAGTVIACSEKSNAQIVYTDVNPDITCTIDAIFDYPLDLNNDGTTDFLIHAYDKYLSSGGGYNWWQVFLIPLNSNEVIGIPVPGLYYASAFYQNDIILAQEQWISGAVASSLVMAGTFDNGYTNKGEWYNVEDRYLGLKLKVNGETLYGWARLDGRNTYYQLYTIKDYAYQSMPDSSILAGQFDCDTLNAVLTPAGILELCSGDSSILSVNQNDPYEVQWLKDGQAIPGTGNEYTVDSSGTYSAVLIGGGCSDTSNAVIIIVHPLSGAGITQSGDTLFSDPASAYQWYLNGSQIPGATNQNFAPAQGGSYQVEVTDANGCMAISQPYDFIPTNVNGASSSDGFNAFVKDHQLTIRFASSPLPSRMILFNALGVKLSEHAIMQSELVLDVSSFAAGIYFVVVGEGENRRVRKVAIE